jgi:hypothetical protein
VKLAHYCVHWTVVSAGVNLDVSLATPFGHCTVLGFLIIHVYKTGQ